MSAIEQELFERIQQLDASQKQRVLDYVRQLTLAGDKPNLSLRELKKLPPDERERRIAESLALAADEDFEIFEAFGEDDFDDYD